MGAIRQVTLYCDERLCWAEIVLNAADVDAAREQVNGYEDPYAWRCGPAGDYCPDHASRVAAAKAPEQR